MKTQKLKPACLALLPIAALALTGCWTMPNANVQPQGEPRLIQSGIQVESTIDPATVEAIDTGANTITLGIATNDVVTYQVGSQVKNLDQIQVGNQVEATVTDELAVYLLANGRLPDGSTAETLGVNAKVLLVDPSYRLLTVQYPDGRQETFKTGLGVKLLEMAPGDDVVVRPVQVIKLH